MPRNVLSAFHILPHIIITEFNRDVYNLKRVKKILKIK